MAIIFLLLIVVLVVYLFSKVKNTAENHSHQSHNFDNIQISAQDFYATVEETMRGHNIPAVNMKRVKYPEGGTFSGSREYLQISRGDAIFDVCAAPYGRGSFVSVWSAEMPGVTKQALRKIPALVPMLEKRTYYQIDTEGMFAAAVNSSISEAIEMHTTAKGARALVGPGGQLALA